MSDKTTSQAPDIMTTTSKTRIIEGQLTTVFTAPEHCSSTRFWAYGSDGATFQTIVAGVFEKYWYCPPPGHRSEDASSCIPTTTTTGSNIFTGPFSPGLHCPYGWHTAMTLFQAEQQYIISGSVLTTTPTQLSYHYPLTTMTRGESGAVCCPREYTFDVNNGAFCFLDRTTGALSGFLCWGGAITATTPTTVALGIASPSNTYIFQYTGTGTVTDSLVNTFVNPVARVSAYPLMLLCKYPLVPLQNEMPSGLLIRSA